MTVSQVSQGVSVGLGVCVENEVKKTKKKDSSEKKGLLLFGRRVASSLSLAMMDVKKNEGATHRHTKTHRDTLKTDNHTYFHSDGNCALLILSVTVVSVTGMVVVVCCMLACT